MKITTIYKGTDAMRKTSCQGQKDFSFVYKNEIEREVIKQLRKSKIFSTYYFHFFDFGGFAAAISCGFFCDDRINFVLSYQYETAAGSLTRLSYQYETSAGSLESLSYQYETPDKTLTSPSYQYETPAGILISLSYQYETAAGILTSLSYQYETPAGILKSLSYQYETMNETIIINNKLNE